MKKNLKLLTGIVFLITILIAGGCSTAVKKDSKKVKIYLKAIEKDGQKHLEMYDSNDPDHVVVDALETIVKPGITVVWKLEKPSGIKKIDEIVSSQGVRNIFEEDAKKRFLSKGFILKIPDGVQAGEEEKYNIVFVDKEDENPWTVDPYLKIPDLP